MLSASVAAASGMVAGLLTYTLLGRRSKERMQEPALFITGDLLVKQERRHGITRALLQISPETCTSLTRHSKPLGIYPTNGLSSWVVRQACTNLGLNEVVLKKPKPDSTGLVIGMNKNADILVESPTELDLIDEYLTHVGYRPTGGQSVACVLAMLDEERNRTEQESMSPTPHLNGYFRIATALTEARPLTVRLLAATLRGKRG
ncbi:hypothetical protein GMRT_14386 [Giardia muris]|uniref:Uncharacterized protein n=1 Tax=Giardia muris TaxID=5742 RepID=A0A4Z1SQT4_GIAMU|nr:hypothetical protein GMRT_14386 [Giardia muris]|eukprot:TNJ28234.1 hypothetical protein GMRT_14386 [Giardia muris]